MDMTIRDFIKSIIEQIDFLDSCWYKVPIYPCVSYMECLNFQRRLRDYIAFNIFTFQSCCDILGVDYYSYILTDFDNREWTTIKNRLSLFLKLDYNDLNNVIEVDFEI